MFEYFLTTIDVRSKNLSPSKFQLDTQSIRDIEPPRSKCCNGKSMSFRQGWC